MTQDFSSLRSTEDILNALSMLYFNLNEIERNYFDIFLNPNAMTVDLQRYDDQGVLETIHVKNLASLREVALTGSGNPDGKETADIGTFYIDTANSDLYYKSSGNGSSGWILLWSGLNLIEGADFLSPTGDGSQVNNLNMDNAGLGILSVARGGTGVGSITGLVKGNGTNAFSPAVDGIDYLGVNSATGIICYYPVAVLPDGETSAIPSGWVMCDGAQYDRSTYSRLFAKIGTTYNESGDTDNSKFRVPNLMDDGNGNPFFIRCWDGSSAFNTVQNSQVGVHNHALNGDTGIEKDHVHDRGSMDITGSFSGVGDSSESPTTTGAIYVIDLNNPPEGVVVANNGAKDAYFGFKASRSWEGVTSGPFKDSNKSAEGHSHSLEGLSTANYVPPSSSTETRVLNKMLIPIIKY